MAFMTSSDDLANRAGVGIGAPDLTSQE
ncbi:hypothetical protein D9619_010179 [Psilocybe cf. subviscida]|uniref:Uncharacterized protein n=1 Tax=Psilocybe cf. subviscida TaxID=2480587 RepID=A0A8H5ES22_9AGAR|nr:hypothetical protein D9619_010179 [Psilocybe cf. subviscida]